MVHVFTIVSAIRFGFIVLCQSIHCWLAKSYHTATDLPLKKLAASRDIQPCAWLISVSDRSDSPSSSSHRGPSTVLGARDTKMDTSWSLTLRGHRSYGAAHVKFGCLDFNLKCPLPTICVALSKFLNLWNLQFSHLQHEEPTGTDLELSWQL